MVKKLHQAPMGGRQFHERANGAVNANLLGGPIEAAKFSDAGCRVELRNAVGKTLVIIERSRIGLRRAILNSVTPGAIKSHPRLASFVDGSS